MTGSALLAALALAAAQAPPTTAPGRPPDAASGAAFVFAEGCLLRLNVDQTGAAFIEGSARLGRELHQEVPSIPAALVMDDAGGAGCRVRYAGPEADAVWTALGGFFDTLVRPGAGCTLQAPAGADRRAAACVSTAESNDPHTATRHGDIVLMRSAPDAVAITLANVRP